MHRSLLNGLFAVVCIAPAAIPAQDAGSQTDTAAPSASAQLRQVVDYPADFFERYQPDTALDMIRQLPGFQLDDGDGSRGFAAAAGNLLINGRRPSAKQDLPSATLARIPASQVARIELLRGQVQGVDFLGHSVLANVWLRTDIPATVRWQLWSLYNMAAPFKPGGSISMSDRLGQIDYNAGIDVERDTSGWVGYESRYDADRSLREIGRDDSVEKGFRINTLNLNASTWAGGTLLQFNSRLTANDTNYRRPAWSVSTGEDRRRRDVYIDTTNRNIEYELGFDAERELTAVLTGKLILLYSSGDTNSDSSQENTDSILGRTLYRLAETDTIAKEQVTRFEFDGSRFADHAIQFNIERAWNLLERRLVQTDDRGSGPQNVIVPGGNSRVEEQRWDLLLQDTWNRGRLTLDLGVGAEASTLSQTGDAELERDFFFLKPLFSAGYVSGAGNRSGIRIAREVSQLDLSDFVSAIVFEDDDIARGNPNIRPESTWVFELSHERRFGRERVIKLSGFYHRINDVLDWLPLTPTVEVPGNIGKGRRTGVELETGFPLDTIGLRGAKLNLRARWQHTRVIDPVTGGSRRLSGQGGGSGYRLLETLNLNVPWHARVDFRQDFEAARFAWGWTVADRGNRPLYRVNELDEYGEGTAIDLFVETTRWFGIKIRVLAENVLSYHQSRERTQYVGERDLSPVDTIIFRDRRNDISRIGLYLNGNF